MSDLGLISAALSLSIIQLWVVIYFMADHVNNSQFFYQQDALFLFCYVLKSAHSKLIQVWGSIRDLKFCEWSQ